MDRIYSPDYLLRIEIKTGDGAKNATPYPSVYCVFSLYSIGVSPIFFLNTRQK